MRMFFKLPKASESVFEINPEFALIPEFVACTDREMQFVMLVADPFSPISHYRFGKRDRLGNTGEIAIRRHAAEHLGYIYNDELSVEGEKLMHNMIDHVAIAIQEYKEIVRFDDAEILQSVINKYRDLLRDFGSAETSEITRMTFWVKLGIS